VIAINLTKIVFLYHKHYPEDGRITGRNMLVNILWIKLHHKIKVYLWVVYVLLKKVFFTG